MIETIRLKSHMRRHQGLTKSQINLLLIAWLSSLSGCFLSPHRPSHKQPASADGIGQQSILASVDLGDRVKQELDTIASSSYDLYRAQLLCEGESEPFGGQVTTKQQSKIEIKFELEQANKLNDKKCHVNIDIDENAVPAESRDQFEFIRELNNEITMLSILSSTDARVTANTLQVDFFKSYQTKSLPHLPLPSEEFLPVELALKIADSQNLVPFISVALRCGTSLSDKFTVATPNLIIESEKVTIVTVAQVPKQLLKPQTCDIVGLAQDNGSFNSAGVFVDFIDNTAKSGKVGKETYLLSRLPVLSKAESSQVVVHGEILECAGKVAVDGGGCIEEAPQELDLMDEARKYFEPLNATDMTFVKNTLEFTDEVEFFCPGPMPSDVDAEGALPVLQMALQPGNKLVTRFNLPEKRTTFSKDFIITKIKLVANNKRLVLYVTDSTNTYIVAATKIFGLLDVEFFSPDTPIPSLGMAGLLTEDRDYKVAAVIDSEASGCPSADAPHP